MAKVSTVPEDKALTPLQQRFIEEYAIDFNGTQAALRAGYSKDSAAAIAFENLKKPHIKAAFKAYTAELTAQCMVDASWMLREFLELYNADPSECFNAKGEMKHIKDWPKAMRKLVNGFTAQTDEIQGSKTSNVKLIDKSKMLEMMGKHKSVQAFLTQIEIKDVTDTADALAAARKRMNQNIAEPSTN